MTRVESLPVHTDPRGSLVEVYSTAAGRLPIHEVHRVTFRRWAVRAGHYHRGKHEYVFVIEGAVEGLLYRPDGTILQRIRLRPGGGLLHIPPGIGHQFTNRKSGQASVLVLSTARFDAARPDKFPVLPKEDNVGQSSNDRRGLQKRAGKRKAQASEIS